MTLPQNPFKFSIESTTVMIHRLLCVIRDFAGLLSQIFDLREMRIR